jgi:hypothetical protein
MTKKEKMLYSGISPSDMCMRVRNQKRNNEYDSLGNAVAARAVEDYKSACKRLVNCKEKDTKKRHNALTEINELEDFFCSDWFTMLTGGMGSYWLNKIKRDAIVIQKYKIKCECVA